MSDGIEHYAKRRAGLEGMLGCTFSNNVCFSLVKVGDKEFQMQLLRTGPSGHDGAT